MSTGDPAIVSGGVEIPAAHFVPDVRPHAAGGTLVADLARLGITSDDLGTLVAGGCVDDCQHNTSFLSYEGELMTLARWPNVLNRSTTGWQWAHAASNFTASPHSFVLDDSTPDARARAPRWASEREAWLHGYWHWDWYRPERTATSAATHDAPLPPARSPVAARCVCGA